MNRRTSPFVAPLAGALCLAILAVPSVLAAQTETAKQQNAMDAHESRSAEPVAIQQAEGQSSPKQKAERRERTVPDQPVAHVPELRDETFRLMDAYFISNLQESLGLTDEQFNRALPLVKRLQSDRRDFARRRMQALRLLRKTLSSGSATEASVGDLLRDLKGASADERSGTLRNLEALDGVLTPLQQAKYRVFEAEVDARLRHLLARSQDREGSRKP